MIDPARPNEILERLVGPRPHDVPRGKGNNAGSATAVGRLVGALTWCRPGV